MSEYRRNETHQFCDTELVMVLDTVTGEPCRFGRGYSSIGQFEQALDYLENKENWHNRTVIVKLQCVKGFEVEQSIEKESQAEA